MDDVPANHVTHCQGYMLLPFCTWTAFFCWWCMGCGPGMTIGLFYRYNKYPEEWHDWIVTYEILCKHILQKFISMSTWIDGNSPLWLDHIQLFLAERVDCSCGRWWCIHGNVPISQFLTWKTYVKTCNNHPVSMHLPINQPNHCWPVQAWLLNPLLKIQKTAENQHVSWVNQEFQMAMSNSSLLPFGNSK